MDVDPWGQHPSLITENYLAFGYAVHKINLYQVWKFHVVLKYQNV